MGLRVLHEIWFSCWWLWSWRRRQPGAKACAGFLLRTALSVQAGRKQVSWSQEEKHTRFCPKNKWTGNAFSFRASRKENILPTPWILVQSDPYQTSDLTVCKVIKFSYWSHEIWDNLYGSNEKLMEMHSHLIYYLCGFWLKKLIEKSNCTIR